MTGTIVSRTRPAEAAFQAPCAERDRSGILRLHPAFESKMALSFPRCSALALGFALFACDSKEVTAGSPKPAISTNPRTAPVPSTRSPAPEEKSPSARDIERALTELSEPTEYFFSDNLISNESSYLQVADELSRRSGGAYLGVGPEQNFTYIALSRPELAVIIDIRRDNALLHLLYKAMFELARDRGHFLCLLLGRPYANDRAVGADATFADVLSLVEREPRSRDVFNRHHDELLRTLRDKFALSLGSTDLESLRRMHDAFFERQLDISFELHQSTGRHYPTLRELLRLESPNHRGSFLAHDADFRFVQDLERRHRVWFVVGDFGKPAALRRVAAELGRRKLTLRSFYVSNVEQYLFGTQAWNEWLANLGAFPLSDESALIRSYLDQGRRHPAQLPGNRAASMLVPLRSWLDCEREKPSGTYYGAVTRACAPTPR
jgi:hypothetical protein